MQIDFDSSKVKEEKEKHNKKYMFLSIRAHLLSSCSPPLLLKNITVNSCGEKVFLFLFK